MNKSIRTRPLNIGPLRTFEAVARLLNFRAAAEELHLTQPAVSRQIKALEDELGLLLFERGTRHVALTGAGHQLRAATLPVLAQLDQTVRQMRRDAGRQVIHLTTFPSFASLWLLPRLEAFQRQHPQLDIRISANDQTQDLEAAGFDLGLGYFLQSPRQGRAEALFGEVLTPVHSPARVLRGEQFNLPPLREPADLVGHTLAEEDDDRPANVHAKWRNWLKAQGLPDLEPRRWLLLNFTHQQVQAALSGQAVALARLPLVLPQLASGELIESFGPARRLQTPAQYWLRLSEGAAHKPEVQHFCDWLRAEAEATREALRA
ncbi:LysR family transcriptional regulator [Inhella gelatinilytica]|uniref:LysR family transcriptional regulator n=1 Tax=Inhella gelatinilytica TaxID=2795030 RepID=A0A931NFK5_9BURK|nr:LysR family transcriptional regulator [Inhella gelatinilytica]MBH9554330.1 LysR family transcriptional regulator [Inhella gelatinilytica]